jgi:hypothetical protein
MTQAVIFKTFQAGRMQERLLVAAAVLRLSVELLPDFFDDAVNELLGADGVEESVLFLAALRR